MQFLTCTCVAATYMASIQGLQSFSYNLFLTENLDKLQFFLTFISYGIHHMDTQCFPADTQVCDCSIRQDAISYSMLVPVHILSTCMSICGSNTSTLLDRSFGTCNKWVSINSKYFVHYFTLFGVFYIQTWMVRNWAHTWSVSTANGICLML